jgi:hypothetical protein
LPPCFITSAPTAAASRPSLATIACCANVACAPAGKRHPAGNTAGIRAGMSGSPAVGRIEGAAATSHADPAMTTEARTSFFFRANLSEGCVREFYPHRTHRVTCLHRCAALLSSILTQSAVSNAVGPRPSVRSSRGAYLLRVGAPPPNPMRSATRIAGMLFVLLVPLDSAFLSWIANE